MEISSSNAVTFYRENHRHPMNRALHAIGVPMITFSFIYMGRMLMIGTYFSLSDLLSLLFVRSYYEYDERTLIFMILYFGGLNLLASMYMEEDGMLCFCLLLQAFAWCLQLIGHYYFEKNRPVFLKSIESSIISAPLHLYYELMPCRKDGKNKNVL